MLTIITKKYAQEFVMNNKEKGYLGEQIALNYLLKKGANILNRNYRIKSGEIDIIAKFNNELVFIEVKSRTSIKFGYPSEAVNYKKINKIINVAKYYLLKNKLDNIDIRFDVIEVYLKNKEVNHIINAF
jgi:putative endonuclease